jgi:hypothetical protein
MERGEAWIAIHASRVDRDGPPAAQPGCCPTQLGVLPSTASRCLLGFARVDALLGRVRSSPTGSQGRSSQPFLSGTSRYQVAFGLFSLFRKSKQLLPLLLQAGLCHGIVCCSGFHCTFMCQLSKMF